MKNKKNKHPVIKGFLLVLFLIFVGVLFLYFKFFSGKTPDYLSQHPHQATIEPQYTPGFWHTQGNQIVDENGSPILLKSMELYGTWWYEDKHYGQAPTWDHDDASYAELKAMGFNAVRLLMGYMFFEKEPYDYHETDWAWIDSNIAWAEANGMKIIFTMEKPQGGTEYFETTDSLFTNAEYQDRFIRMWQCIAERYKDCTTIAGWELMNEPLIDLFGDREKQYATICDVMQRTTNAIRTVDQNHMIFCERCTGTAKNDLLKKAAKVIDKQNLYLYPYIEDYNLVQTFHCHYPHTFTMRYGFWDEYPGNYLFTYVDRNQLKNELQRIKRLFDQVYGTDQNPVFISEFCVKFRADDIKKDQGYQWLADTMEAMNELGYSYSYDRYHSDTVGLWDAKTWQNYNLGKRDDILALLFFYHNH